MIQVRFTKSIMGKYLEPKIYNFIMDNINHTKDRQDIGVEVGSEMVANAVVYGISLALSSEIMKTAFAVGITPPPVSPSTVTPGGPIGMWVYQALKSSVIQET